MFQPRFFLGLINCLCQLPLWKNKCNIEKSEKRKHFSQSIAHHCTVQLQRTIRPAYLLFSCQHHSDTGQDPADQDFLIGSGVAN